MREPDLALDLILHGVHRLQRLRASHDQLLTVVKELAATAKITRIYPDVVKREALVESLELLGKAAIIAIAEAKRV
jgi:hypothetical protein